MFDCAENAEVLKKESLGHRLAKFKDLRGGHHVPIGQENEGMRWPPHRLTPILYIS